MSETPASLPPAGWYADAGNPGQDRWWNGSGWSDQRRPSIAVPPIPPPGPIITPTPAAAPLPPAPGASDPRPNPYAGPPVPPAPAYAAPATSGQPYAGYPAARSANPNVPGLVGFIISMAAVLLNLWLFGLVGIAGGIVSIVGLNRAKRLRQQGIRPDYRGLALAGVIVGFATSLFTILFYVLFFVATTDAPSYYY